MKKLKELKMLMKQKEALYMLMVHTGNPAYLFSI